MLTHTEPFENAPESILQIRQEKIIITFLIAFCALRIFLFSAAFPFFNNVDEPLHFDQVYRYSFGDTPRKAVSHVSRANAEFMIMYMSPEYFAGPAPIVGKLPPQPFWTNPTASETSNFRSKVERCKGLKNHEAGSFPLPYYFAGLWCKMGRALGMEGGKLLYWIRFLNVPIFALLLWLSWVVARSFFPDDAIVRIGLPLIMAFFPQDLFYSITNDNFSALFFALAFLLLLEITFKNMSSVAHISAGLAVAITFLSKISNVSVLALLGLVIFIKGRNLLIRRKLRQDIPNLILLLVSACVPIMIIFCRNHLLLGDFTGTADVISFKGWTFQPFSEWLHHPIFTQKGLFYWLKELTKTFWRGEFIWHGKRLAYEWVDIVYVLTTGFFLLAACWYIFQNNNERKRLVLIISLFVTILSLLFLAFLSVCFDFGKWFYPSKSQPYFTNGRLISSVTIPFFLLYLNGIKMVFSKIGSQKAAFVFILLLVILVSVSEIMLTWGVFKSPFNWFHLNP